jgi:hypothetical protein
MSKIAEAQMRIQLETIAKKISQGFTDKQIMQELPMKERAYYYNKKKVYAIYGNIAERKTDLKWNS